MKGENAKTPYINIKVQITKKYANYAKNTCCSKILVTSEKITVLKIWIKFGQGVEFLENFKANLSKLTLKKCFK